MIDDWFEVIELPLTIEQLRTLPSNPAFNYEFIDGISVLIPRPRCYHALLELRRDDLHPRFETWGVFPLRPFREGDWDGLEEVFSLAFRGVQPFAAMDDDRRLEAARLCLQKTRSGGDGPLVSDACWVAVDPETDRPVAAILITRRDVQVPSDRVVDPSTETPHLTWIFVSPPLARHGIGSALLEVATQSLVRLGLERLGSTFLLGNESSTLWHWRNGFRLMGYSRSPRRYEPNQRSYSKPLDVISSL